jgi:hypothetical protein
MMINLKVTDCQKEGRLGTGTSMMQDFQRLVLEQNAACNP